VAVDDTAGDHDAGLERKDLMPREAIVVRSREHPRRRCEAICFGEDVEVGVRCREEPEHAVYIGGRAQLPGKAARTGDHEGAARTRDRLTRLDRDHLDLDDDPGVEAQSDGRIGVDRDRDRPCSCGRGVRAEDGIVLDPDDREPAVRTGDDVIVIRQRHHGARHGCVPLVDDDTVDGPQP